jgi:glutamine---fructose-6-phosphate transaminase (isomerizing)
LLPVVPDVHPIAAQLTVLPSFYALLNSIAMHRGTDPDNPPYLIKATQTL